MRLEQLHYIYSIISFGSLRSAANQLHTTQQNLSAFVANLEKEIGTEIFTRSPEGMRLTENGKQLLPLFYTLTDTYEKILSNNIDVHKCFEEKGTLRFACHFIISRFIVSEVMENFRQTYPNIDLSIIEINSNCLEDIQHIDKDFDAILFPLDQNQMSFISNSTKSTQYNVRPIVKDSLVLICSSESPLAKRKKVSVSMLTNYSYVAFFTEKAEDTWTFKKVFLEHNVLPKRISQCNIETLYFQTIVNGSISLSTHLTARHTDLSKQHNIVAVPFKEDMSFYFVLKERMPSKNAVSYFSQLVEQALQRYLN